MILSLVLSATLWVQVDAADAAQDLLGRLVREDDEDREAARYGLTRLEPSIAPTLWKMRPFQASSGARFALREAISILYERWGWQLYAEGRVEESLDRFAQAAEAPDIEAYSRARLEKAEDYIRRWTPGPLEGCYIETPGAPSRWAVFGANLLKVHGPWGMGAVLRGTRTDQLDRDDWGTLHGMGDPAVPVLCRVVSSGDRKRGEEAFSTLYTMAEDYRLRLTSSKTWRDLARSVAENPEEPESKRKMATEMLWRLGPER